LDLTFFVQCLGVHFFTGHRVHFTYSFYFSINFEVDNLAS